MIDVGWILQSVRKVVIGLSNMSAPFLHKKQQPNQVYLSTSYKGQWLGNCWFDKGNMSVFSVFKQRNQTSEQLNMCTGSSSKGQRLVNCWLVSGNRNNVLCV